MLRGPARIGKVDEDKIKDGEQLQRQVTESVRSCED